jgi:hypothetical protein
MGSVMPVRLVSPSSTLNKPSLTGRGTPPTGSPLAWPSLAQ